MLVPATRTTPKPVLATPGSMPMTTIIRVLILRPCSDASRGGRIRGLPCLTVVVRHRERTAERELERIASAQHGVVTRAEALVAGVTAAELRQRLYTGALLRVHRGVYRVGHRAPSIEATYLAAVRACGLGALLSGRAAAHLYGFLRGSAPVPEVITPTQRRIPGVITRRSRAIDPLDATTWRAIPITTVPRTLVELAADLPVEDLARACHEAGVRFRTSPAQVEVVLERRPNSQGSAKLPVLRGDERVTVSTLERRFLTVLHGARLPLPQTNRPAGGRRVDCRWPEYRLTVELDSYRYHGSRPRLGARSTPRARGTRPRG
ncbi:MAG: type IV toxin-antitoxin system AbiEi family antitoxin domain-containing protein [Solirubrobacterales bacterium]